MNDIVERLRSAIEGHNDLGCVNISVRLIREVAKLIEDLESYKEEISEIANNSRNRISELQAEATSHAAERQRTDDLIEEVKRVVAALAPRYRAPGCWCDQSHDINGYGHEPRCVDARALLSKLEER